MAIGTHCMRATRTAAPDETAAVAARRMQAEHVGCLVVVENDRPIGVVTDRDIALHVLCDDLDPEKERVRDAMHGPVVSVRQDASLEEALKALRKASVRRLVVTDEAGKAAGVFAADDFLRLLATELGDLAEALRVQFTREAKSAGGAGGTSHA
ncbi:MAG: CBS domain-containing protein [Proteobacteria bacterium]|nr:MAG: CBS domain-containing protein [Pseudomonadota bacterium]